MHTRHRATVESHLVVPARGDGSPPRDANRRIRQLAMLCAAGLALVMTRVMQIELTQGSGFRAAAVRPIEKRRPLPAARGRIISSDGQVLAYDERISSLAVHYRYLESPPNARWLRSQARARVPRDEPRRAARLASEHAWIRVYRDELLDHLASLCGRPADELEMAAGEIQRRVRRVADNVNYRNQQRRDRTDEQEAAAGPWHDLRPWLPAWLVATEIRRLPPRIVVGEELDYHVLVEDVPLEVVAEIEAHPERYPGLRIVEQSLRRYPSGTLAANVVGHLGWADETVSESAPADSSVARLNARATSGPRQHAPFVGRQGAERHFEDSLAGQDGLTVELTDHGGHWLETRLERAAVAGRDLVMTLDGRLQRVAEHQLDRALAHDTIAARHAGGAVVILDIQSGEVLVSASSPRFNPNLFVGRDRTTLQRVLDDPAHPLFDRVTRMALPPGSIFKVVTALALLADNGFDPHAPFDCQGYLSQPDRQRCQIFRRYGIGHGTTNLELALMQSCNVYFFHHAERVGIEPLVDCAARLGFGQATGIDAPDEAAGFLPRSIGHSVEPTAWKLADTQALGIGQSTLTATPLQVARLMAAVANGGRLVPPRFTAADAAVDADRPAAESSSAPRPGLAPQQLEIVRRALSRVANDPDGTAYAVLADCGVPVAGKTGTAETGEHSADHAWFAGYAPADRPRYAFAVALEHHGSADQAAAIAKELVQTMHALGMLSARPTAEIAEHFRE